MTKFKTGILRMKNYITMASVVMILAFPTFASAASSPEGKIKNLFNAVIDLLSGVAFVIATAALLWNLINMYFAGESHKKAELKENIATIAKITCVIPMANLLVKWIGSFFM